jgi:hypothetical protein
MAAVELTRETRCERGGGGTAMKKLRIVILVLGFGTARQKRVLE